MLAIPKQGYCLQRCRSKCLATPAAPLQNFKWSEDEVNDKLDTGILGPNYTSALEALS